MNTTKLFFLFPLLLGTTVAMGMEKQGPPPLEDPQSPSIRNTPRPTEEESIYCSLLCQREDTEDAADIAAIKAAQAEAKALQAQARVAALKAQFAHKQAEKAHQQERDFGLQHGFREETPEPNNVGPLGQIFQMFFPGNPGG